MNTKSIVAGVLAGVAFFLLGWLLYGMLLTDLMAGMEGSATGVMKSDDEMMGSMHFLAIGQLVLGLFLAYIFSTWANISTAMGGAKGGAVIGAFVSIGFDFTMLGTSNIMTLSGVIVDVVVSVVIFAAAGAVAGWWLGRK